MDVDEFGRDAGFLPLGLVVAPLLSKGDMVLVFFDDEGTSFVSVATSSPESLLPSFPLPSNGGPAASPPQG
jgi:hypothetical protein